jgi:uncharacterized oxidoreductase
MPTIPLPRLLSATTRVFASAGLGADEARAIAEHLVEAEADGVRSHGLIRVPQYLRLIAEGKIRVGAGLRVLKEGPATAVLDGGRGPGPVMARRAMDKAMALAGASGIGAVTLVNCSHTGRLGSYTVHAARRGMIGLMMVNGGGTGHWVAPFGGRAGRLATNPLSIAAPAENGAPMVIDMSTSMAPEGKVRAAKIGGQRLPDGWLIGPDGTPANDPNVLYGEPRGALLPVGGHKGYGLAMMVEAMAGALSGAGCCAPAKAGLEGTTDGVFALALRVEAFVAPEDYQAEIDGLLRHVRSCPPAPGSDGVLAPGEPEARARAKSERDGVTVGDAVWEQLRQAGVPLGLRWDDLAA